MNKVLTYRFNNIDVISLELWHFNTTLTMLASNFEILGPSAKFFFKFN